MKDIVITSSILILAVFIMRYIAKGRIAPLLQYALWLPVVIRLLLPVPLWNSRFSVLNYLPDSMNLLNDVIQGEETAAPSSMIYQDVDSYQNGTSYPNGVNTDNAATASPTGAAVGMPQTDSMENTGTERDTPQDGNAPQSGEDTILPAANPMALLYKLLSIIWIAGMVVTGSYMLFYQRKWKRYLYRNRKPLKGMEEYHGLKVYAVKGLPSPCLSGRCIYLTKEMAADEKRLKHILTHEYCHYRHGDSLWVIVRCVLTIVYWFHPLVWAAAYASKQDSELACDEASIRLLGEEERIAYGKTLLRLIAGEEQERKRMGFASTMSGGEKGIRERISRIAKKRQYAAAAAGGVVLLAAVLVMVTFSGSRQEENAIQEESAIQEENAIQAADASDIRVEILQDAIEMQEQALRGELEELAEEEADREYEAAVDSAAILKRLSAYDEKIDVLGSQGNVYGIYGAKNVADYVQPYYENGEDALEEGIYQLEKVKGSDGSDITVYGMYTKEYGCRGVKILIGNDVNDFDEPWLVSGMHGREESIHVYEYAQDGMPRTFACKMIAEETSAAEVWNLYFCDRYDTGTIDFYQFEAQDYREQINSRLRLEIESSENKPSVIVVYDSGHRIGEIEVPASEAAAKEIKEALLNTSIVNFELGVQENKLKLLTAVGIRLDKTDEIWYNGLPLISFPVVCGSMGAREFQLGEASIESQSVMHVPQSADSLDELCILPSVDNTKDTENVLAQAFDAEGAHYDAEVVYCNPCPSYTRISDTFGERVNPITQEKRMHNGVDLAAESGADIVAAADGTVYQTGYDAANGRYVVLYHAANGEFTYYAACQDILVTEGEAVTAGERIATVGSTGRSTGAHLHFAVSRDGEYIEPVFE